MAQKQKSEKEVVLSAGAAAAPIRKSAGTRTKSATASPRKKHSAPQIQAPLVTVTEPGHDEIAALAYSYWEARGQQGGSPEEDWLRAEQQLRARA